MKRLSVTAASFLLGVQLGGGGETAQAQEVIHNRAGVPIFEVDPSWPKLPENWTLGQTIGIDVDEEDHIWINNRPHSLDAQRLLGAQDPPKAACCIPPQPILVFDKEGNFIRGWGGPGEGYEWPNPEGPETRPAGDGRAANGEHGVFVDHQGYVWVGGNSSDSHHILKFTKDGRFVMQIGREGQSKGSNDTANFKRPAGFAIHAPTNELFVADGYGNRRVIVFDAVTGEYKRHWGAYGNRPDDSTPATPRLNSAPPPQQFNTVHGIGISRDGLVYAADRGNNRVQVFTLEGRFLKEAFVRRETEGPGTVFDLAFSHDPDQQFIYIADGSNQNIVIMERQTLEIVGQIGRYGRNSGQFHHLHSITTDSEGNIYTGECLGYRAQKFIFRGYSTAASTGARALDLPVEEAKSLALAHLH